MYPESPSFYTFVDNTTNRKVHNVRIVGDAKKQKVDQAKFASTEGEDAEDNAYLTFPEDDEEETDPTSSTKIQKRKKKSKSTSSSSKLLFDLQEGEEIVDKYDEDDDDMEITEKGVAVIQCKDGTKKIVFSGEQKDVSAKMLKNIKDKLAKSKKAEIIDFQVDR